MAIVSIWDNQLLTLSCSYVKGCPLIIISKLHVLGRQSKSAGWMNGWMDLRWRELEEDSCIYTVER